MNINKHTVAAVALARLFASPAFAREPLTVIEMIDHLEELLADCNWKTRNLKGGHWAGCCFTKKLWKMCLKRSKPGVSLSHVNSKRRSGLTRVHDDVRSGHQLGSKAIAGHDQDSRT